MGQKTNKKQAPQSVGTFFNGNEEIEILKRPGNETGNKRKIEPVGDFLYTIAYEEGDKGEKVPRFVPIPVELKRPYGAWKNFGNADFFLPSSFSDGENGVVQLIDNGVVVSSAVNRQKPSPIEEKYAKMIRNMKKIREEKGVTQQEIANDCGLSKNYVSSLERGVNRCSAETLIGYAECLGVPVSSLVGEMTGNKIIPELQAILSGLDEKTQRKIAKVIELVLEQ